jgi:nickel/cobalt exporter
MLDSAITLGLIFGVRHACDADHVCAMVSLLKSGQGVRGSLRIALLWSLGHSATFFALGFVLIAGRITMPPNWDPFTELLVAASLIGLGLVQWRHADCPVSVRPAQRTRLSGRVVLLGIVHGLAGSTGVALLALTTMRERISALLFLLLFGTGVSVGMLLLTVLLSFPFRFAGESNQWHSWIIKGASSLSIGVGVWIAVVAGQQMLH